MTEFDWPDPHIKREIMKEFRDPTDKTKKIYFWEKDIDGDVMISFSDENIQSRYIHQDDVPDLIAFLTEQMEK